MQDKLEETRQQLHEIQNLLGHLNLGMRDLEKQIAGLRISLEHRLERIEVALNLPPESGSPSRDSLPVHEDKKGPELLPPQKPGM